MSPRLVAICAVALALSACAATTQNGMRERGAVLAEKSLKSTEEIIGCVSKSGDANGMAFNYTPRVDGGQLIVRGWHLPMLMLDVIERGGQREANFYLFKSIWPKQNQARIEEIKACL